VFIHEVKLICCPSRRHVRMSTFLHSKGQRGLRGRIALTIFLAGICESDHAVRKLQVIWHSGSLAANLVPVNDHYRFGTFDNEVNRTQNASCVEALARILPFAKLTSAPTKPGLSRVSCTHLESVATLDHTLVTNPF
jgi:hypothetical protein